ncbi:MAG: maleylpyruvate isomerase family mycothiol-dependent enzyme [Microthrixaceae bacterium]
MALPRDVVAEGIVAEMKVFEDLLRSLDGAEWEQPSRCVGWTVGDVARHVVGSMADVVAGNLDGLGTPEVTAREVEERQGRSAAEIADELSEVATASVALLAVFDDAAWVAEAPGGYDGTLGDGVEALWYDFWLHADDIRAATGRASEPGESLKAGISHVVFELDKRGWTGEIGPDPMAFILAATGRGDASSLSVPAPINIYAE